MDTEKKAELCLKSVCAELDKAEPNAKACLALIGEMGAVLKGLDYEILEELSVLKTLGKITRPIKRHKRSSQGAEDWESALAVVNKLQMHCRTTSKVHVKATHTPKPSLQPGNPTTVKEYRARLVVQKKDMYKDPPVLPPLNIQEVLRAGSFGGTAKDVLEDSVETDWIKEVVVATMMHAKSPDG
ncbi:MAG: hypothetical protein SGBAC_008602 [Bacillariaceae sp.]